jgi:hypothetical protein
VQQAWNTLKRKWGENLVNPLNRFILRMRTSRHFAYEVVAKEVRTEDAADQKGNGLSREQLEQLGKSTIALVAFSIHP